MELPKTPPDAADGGLAAIGPLRDFPSPAAGPAPTPSRISDYNNAKIRNLCFLLSVMVVFNHAITAGDLRDWAEGQATTATSDAALGAVELVAEHFVSGSLGRITNPVFFAVSGYLFFWGWRPDWRSLRRKWGRRAFTLVVPFAVWGLAGRGLWFLDHLWINRSALGRMMVEGRWGWGEAWVTFWGMNGPSQLWFIEQLIWQMLVVAPVLALILPRGRWWCLLPVVALYFLPAPETLWILRKGPLCFFVAGALLGCLTQPLDFRNRRWRWVAAIVWVGAGAIYTGVALWVGGSMTLLLKVVVLLGVVGSWGAYDLLPATWHRRLGAVSPYRFFVYMGFDPLMPILQRHFLTWFDQGQWTRLMAYVTFPAVSVLVCLATAWVLHRSVPALYFVITGGRSPVPVAHSGPVSGSTVARGP